MVDGTTMTLGGREFTLPPLSLAQTRKFHLNGKLAKLPWNGPQLLFATTKDDGGAEFMEELAIVAEVVTEAVRRNHPEVTDEEMLELLDLGNLAPVLKAVLGAAGLAKQGAPGEAKRP
jgi:hypothetical protein